jgi:hypothetical protein
MEEATAASVRNQQICGDNIGMLMNSVGDESAPKAQKNLRIALERV